MASHYDATAEPTLWRCPMTSGRRVRRSSPRRSRAAPAAAGAATGPDPTHRSKLGTKLQVLSDRRGSPLSVVLSAAQRTDRKLAEATLDGVVVPRPRPRPGRPQHLCRDKGFDYPATDQ